MDNTVTEIFDAFDRLSDYTQKLDKIRILREQLKEATSETCGNCARWMKTTCKPEKERNEFKSSDSIACTGFVQDRFSRRFEAEYRNELKAIEEEMTTGGAAAPRCLE